MEIARSRLPLGAFRGKLRRGPPDRRKVIRRSEFVVGVIVVRVTFAKRRGASRAPRRSRAERLADSYSRARALVHN